MKLHQFPFAPNAAKVRLYLAEKTQAGCALGIEECLVNLIEGDHKQDAYLAINPRGTVPALELDDGRVIHESLPIMEYIEELHPAPSFWGDTPEERAYARQIERTADLGGLIPIATEIHATNSPLGLPPNPAVAESARARWERGIGYLEAQMGDGRPFLAGDRVTVGDCTLQGILQFARFRELDVLGDSPRLAAWCDRFRERPAAKATIVI